MITAEEAEKAANFLRDHAPVYAKAKAERVYLEEFRKTRKAILMRQSGEDAVNAQEREAYANPEYRELLEGLRAAVEAEETERWMLVAAQTKIEMWRSLEASARMVDRGNM